MAVVHNCTLGCDPEFFLRDAGDNFVAAYGKFKGTKGAPEPLPLYGGGYLEDGAAIEINPRPAASAEDWETNVNGCIDELKKSVLAPLKLNLWCASTATLSVQDIANPLSRIMGCDPDWNAHTLQKRESLDLASMGHSRHAAGHIHFGLDPWPEGLPKHVFVKFCDLLFYIGIMRYDSQNARRRWYGQAGLFRPKPYGIEYRTPSNALFANSQTIKIVGHQAFSFLYTFRHYEENEADLINLYDAVDWEFVRLVVNTGLVTTRNGSDKLKTYYDIFSKFCDIPYYHYS